MIQLNLPSYSFKTSRKGEKTWIFDSFRKSWFVLTPEEWVRQNFLTWLCHAHGYPKGLIAVEATLKYNTLKMRADAVVYSPNGKPLMIVECKAPGVSISQQTLEQAARYNFSFQTRYLTLTNGLMHYCCRIDLESKKLVFLDDFPGYKEIC